MPTIEAWQIKRVRRQIDLTQEEMATLLGTSSATVLRYEHGTARPDRYAEELLGVLAQIARDPDRAHKLHALLKADTERTRVLWSILNWVYGDKPPR